MSRDFSGRVIDSVVILMQKLQVPLSLCHRHDLPKRRRLPL